MLEINALRAALPGGGLALGSAGGALAGDEDDDDEEAGREGVAGAQGGGSSARVMGALRLVEARMALARGGIPLDGLAANEQQALLELQLENQELR